MISTNNGNNVKNFIFQRYYIPDNSQCTDEEVKEYYKCLIDCIFFIPQSDWETYIDSKFSDRYFKILAKESLQKYLISKDQYEKKCNTNRNNINARWANYNKNKSDPRKSQNTENVDRKLNW